MGDQTDITRRHRQDWFQFVMELGFSQQVELQAVFELHDPDLVEDPGQKALFFTGRGKSRSLEGNIREAKSDLDNGLEIAEEFSLTRAHPYAEELRAYGYYESALFWLKVGVEDRSWQHLRHALRAAKSPILSLLVRFQREMLQNRRLKQLDLEQIQRYRTEFERLELPIMQIIALRHQALLQRQAGDAQGAEKTLLRGEALALERDQMFLLEQLQNARAFLYLQAADYRAARELFTSLLSRSYSNFVHSVVLENLALVAEAEEDPTLAADFCQQALANSRKHDVISKIPEECLYLGDLNAKTLGDIESAEQFYRIGHDESLQQVATGFPLSGERETIVLRYQEFIRQDRTGSQRAGRFSPFRKLRGKSWRRITDLFQYNLLSFHIIQGLNKDDILRSLDLKSSTYYAQRKRLEDAGYRLPASRKHPAVAPLDSSKCLLELQRYIQILPDPSWTAANQRFEEEILSFLFKEVGYQKRRLAEKLEVSYPTILAKTKYLKAQSASAPEENVLPNG